MAHIPMLVAESSLSQRIQRAGLKRIHQGKVADTYELPNGYRLVVRTNRVSIFDFVLPCTIPGKGSVLTEMTVFWLRTVFKDWPHHLIAAGHEIDVYLPSALRNNEQLRSCAIVVKTLPIIPIECIMRGYLTGSGWDSYQEKGSVCGIELPQGLHDGSELSPAIFTPTTKEEEDHDRPILCTIVEEKHGSWMRMASRMLYDRACKHALQKGIIIADTKFEFGTDDKGGCVLADEVFTPDSSRFWDLEEWEIANEAGESPPSWDKQFLRNWGKNVPTEFKDEDGKDIVGIHKLDRQNAEHVAFVDQVEIPLHVAQQTAAIYRKIRERLMN